jgi:DNA repair ATPase RecN
MSDNELGGRLDHLVNETAHASNLFEIHRATATDEAGTMADRVIGLRGLEEIIDGVSRAIEWTEDQSDRLGDDDDDIQRERTRLYGTDDLAGELRAEATAITEGSNSEAAATMVGLYEAIVAKSDEVQRSYSAAASMSEKAFLDLHSAVQSLKRALGKLSTVKETMETAREGFEQTGEREQEAVRLLEAAKESTRAYRGSL